MKNAKHIRQALHHAAFQHFALLAPGVDPDGAYDVVAVYVFVRNGDKRDAERAALQALSSLPLHASEWTISCFHAEQEAAIRSAIGQPMTEFHPVAPERTGYTRTESGARPDTLQSMPVAPRVRGVLQLP